MQRKPLNWQIDISLFMNCSVRIETNDGHVRQRTSITEVRWTKLSLDGRVVEYPHELVFENDDAIPFSQMRSILRIA